VLLQVLSRVLLMFEQGQRHQRRIHPLLRRAELLFLSPLLEQLHRTQEQEEVLFLLCLQLEQLHRKRSQRALLLLELSLPRQLELERLLQTRNLLQLEQAELCLLLLELELGWWQRFQKRNLPWKEQQQRESSFSLVLSMLKLHRRRSLPPLQELALVRLPLQEQMNYSQNRNHH
jgi:hypothetical protein